MARKRRRRGTSKRKPKSVPYQMQSPYSEGRSKLLEVALSGPIKVDNFGSNRSKQLSRYEDHALYKKWAMQSLADKGKLCYGGKVDQKEIGRRMSSMVIKNQHKDFMTHAQGGGKRMDDPSYVQR